MGAGKGKTAAVTAGKVKPPVKPKTATKKPEKKAQVVAAETQPVVFGRMRKPAKKAGNRG